MESAWVAMARAVTWKTAGSKFARDFEHVGNHQQQALRRRERGGKRAGLQRAVHAAHRAAFALQRHHRRDGAPEVLLSLGRPLIAELGHRR